MQTLNSFHCAAQIIQFENMLFGLGEHYVRKLGGEPLIDKCWRLFAGFLEVGAAPRHHGFFKARSRAAPMTRQSLCPKQTLIVIVVIQRHRRRCCFVLLLLLLLLVLVLVLLFVSLLHMPRGTPAFMAQSAVLRRNVINLQVLQLTFPCITPE